MNDRRVAWLEQQAVAPAGREQQRFVRGADLISGADRSGGEQRDGRLHLGERFVRGLVPRRVARRRSRRVPLRGVAPKDVLARCET